MKAQLQRPGNCRDGLLACAEVVYLEAVHMGAACTRVHLEVPVPVCISVF